MSISVVCECGKKLTAPDERAGKQGKCPTCGKVLRLPPRQFSGQPPSLPAEQPKSVASNPNPRESKTRSIALASAAAIAIVAVLLLVASVAYYQGKKVGSAANAMSSSDPGKTVGKPDREVESPEETTESAASSPQEPVTDLLEPPKEPIPESPKAHKIPAVNAESQEQDVSDPDITVSLLTPFGDLSPDSYTEHHGSFTFEIPCMVCQAKATIENRRSDGVQYGISAVIVRFQMDPQTRDRLQHFDDLNVETLLSFVDPGTSKKTNVSLRCSRSTYEGLTPDRQKGLANILSQCKLTPLHRRHMPNATPDP